MRKSTSPDVAPGEKDALLPVCALFEGNFSIDWLEELTRNRASYILSALEKGAQQGILVRDEIGIFHFKDSKKRDHWQSYLSSDEKERLHRQIAEYLLKELPEDNNKLQELAYHLLHFPNDLEKCRWLDKAGDANLKAFQIEKALRFYAKLLDDLLRLSGQEADLLFADVAIKYSKISTARHDTTKVISTLEKASSLAKKHDNKIGQALLEMHLAKNEWLRSQYHDALNHFKNGWAIAKKLNDNRLMRSATTFSTFFLYWQGRFREALQSYERTVPDVEKFPQDGFPLLSALTVAICYAHTGHITQGLGMLDTIRARCQERGDQYTKAYVDSAIGSILLDINQIEEAIQYLECADEEAIKSNNNWVRITTKLIFAFAYFLRGDKKKSTDYLYDYVQNSTEVHMTVKILPYLMDLCWAMEQGSLDRILNLSLAEEINRMLIGDNIFIKGVAYRYRALLQKRESLPNDAVIQSLKASIEFLKESGDHVELVKSQLELMREYFSQGQETKAKEAATQASKVLSSLGRYGEALRPNDLKSLIDKPPLGEALLHEILKLGQEVVTIRDNSELIQYIISKVNQITGAERGAIFLVEGKTPPSALRLRGSKNITSEQIANASFASSMKMVEEVALKGNGCIKGMSSLKDLDLISSEIIRSRICVPMVLREKVVGVLYHDNRLLSSAFEESDLELLSYFAALAAFALDNAEAYEEIQRLNQRLGEEKLYYEERHLEKVYSENIVGQSPAMKSVLAQVDQVANTESTVLILGETGVGKDLLAREIHRRSFRRDKPYIQVNCSVLPESIIQSELFGHEKGSFTGAIHRRIGRFELADEGTLFLDEIGDLPLEIQVRLLHVLQGKQFERVGGNETIYSDFRLVAATNRNLEQEVRENRFRADLFYRLNVFPIQVPPLRERKEDIPFLAHHFLTIYGAKRGKAFYRIPDLEIDKLVQYDWPGNVRELENIIERGAILSSPPHFRIPDFGSSRSEIIQPKSVLSLKENERQQILQALQKTGWKIRGQGGAAELLDIHPSTLVSRMKKLGIQRPKGIPKKRSTVISQDVGME
jgi:formate hydrogenlyase transcriptional activator